VKHSPATHVFDPICGMWLDVTQASITLTYIGWTYAFCSFECRELFARAPDVHVIRMAHDPEAYPGYWCPFQRQSASGDTMSDTRTSESAGQEQAAGR
jgi:YHS domain-containing protein